MEVNWQHGMKLYRTSNRFQWNSMKLTSLIWYLQTYAIFKTSCIFCQKSQRQFIFETRPSTRTVSWFCGRQYEHHKILIRSPCNQSEWKWTILMSTLRRTNTAHQSLILSSINDKSHGLTGTGKCTFSFPLKASKFLLLSIDTIKYWILLLVQLNMRGPTLLVEQSSEISNSRKLGTFLIFS